MVCELVLSECDVFYKLTLPHCHFDQRETRTITTDEVNRMRNLTKIGILGAEFLV